MLWPGESVALYPHDGEVRRVCVLLLPARTGTHGIASPEFAKTLLAARRVLPNGRREFIYLHIALYLLSTMRLPHWLLLYYIILLLLFLCTSFFSLIYIFGFYPNSCHAISFLTTTDAHQKLSVAMRAIISAVGH